MPGRLSLFLTMVGAIAVAVAAAGSVGTAAPGEPALGWSGAGKAGRATFVRKGAALADAWSSSCGAIQIRADGWVELFPADGPAAELGGATAGLSLARGPREALVEVIACPESASPRRWVLARRMVGRDRLLIALVGSEAEREAMRGALEALVPATGAVWVESVASQLPTGWEGYDGLDWVVLTEGAQRRLSSAAARGLLRWVAAGGQVLAWRGDGIWRGASATDGAGSGDASGAVLERMIGARRGAPGGAGRGAIVWGEQRLRDGRVLRLSGPLAFTGEAGLDGLRMPVRSEAALVARERRVLASLPPAPEGLVGVAVRRTRMMLLIAGAAMLVAAAIGGRGLGRGLGAPALVSIVAVGAGGAALAGLHGAASVHHVGTTLLDASDRASHARVHALWAVQATAAKRAGVTFLARGGRIRELVSEGASPVDPAPVRGAIEHLRGGRLRLSVPLRPGESRAFALDAVVPRARVVSLNVERDRAGRIAALTSYGELTVEGAMVYARGRWVRLGDLEPGERRVVRWETAAAQPGVAQAGAAEAAAAGAPRPCAASAWLEALARGGARETQAVIGRVGPSALKLDGQARWAAPPETWLVYRVADRAGRGEVR